MATLVRPRESKSVLEPMKDTYAVENGMLYDYYSIHLGERKGDFVTLTKLPPVMREGYVTYQKRLFKVTLRDFLRNRVNVGQPAYNPNATTATVTAVEPPATPAVEVAARNIVESGTDPVSGLPIDEAANLAFEEQIRTLLFLDDSEEEWQYETTAQSGLADASSTV